MTLARTIYALRLTRKMNRPQFAAQAGISREHLWAVETGQYALTLYTAEKIASAFGVSLGRLFDSRIVLIDDPLIQACVPHIRMLDVQQRKRVLKILRTIGAPKWLQRHEQRLKSFPAFGPGCSQSKTKGNT